MVTAFFCDIINSSYMVIPQDPEDAYDQLSGLIDIMRRHVAAFGGTICQTLGDGVYAVFGAPVALENHAVRACFAADGILREVARSGRAVRIGMASGEVLWDHDSGAQTGNPATGATIHIAAKLQQMAAPNRAVMTDATARLAADWVETEESSLVVLAGEEPLQTHQLTSVRSRRRQDEEVLPMVGRENIRSYLLSTLEGMATGNGGFSAHLVQAAPGLGKTRLVRSLAASARKTGIRVLELQVPPVEPVGAVGPLHQLVAALLDGPLPRTPEGLSAMLRAAGAQPEQADALARILLPTLTDNQDRGTSAILSLAASAMAMLVRSVAERRTLLLLVEDMHWADTAVQATALSLLDLPESTRLLLVLTSREEGLNATIATHRRLGQHTLGPLSISDTTSLLDHWLGRYPGLDKIKLDLSRRARGNPFFLVECIRVLMMNGTLQGDVGNMRPGEMPAYPLPDSVQALLSVRIDMLGEAARRVLRFAAVAGPTFDVALLSRLIGAEDAGRYLPELARLGLIDETRLLPRQEYSFHHALLHEAVYACITRRDRRQIHGRLAELLDQEAFTELSGRLAAQARHAAAGALWTMAVRAGVAAGREALNRSLAAEAVSLLSIAVEANENLPVNQDSLEAGIDLRIALAKAAMPAGMGDRAMTELDRAVSLARQAGDQSRAMVGLVQQINYEWVYGSLAQALLLAGSAISYSGGEMSAHPELLIIAASCHIENDDPENALRLLEIAAGVSGRDQHVAGRYTMLNVDMMISIKKARCRALLGQLHEAEPLIQHALRLADGDRFPFNRVFVRADIAEIRLRQRRFGDVLAYSSESLSLSRSTGAPLFDAVNLARRGLALSYMGRGIAGLADIDQGLGIAIARGAALHIAKARQCRAVAFALTGQLQQAQQERASAAVLADERGFRLLGRQLPSLAELTDIAAQARSNLNLLSIR
ncbi:ATP-binding protein [Niveispirillum lacus]|nr:adenylate/guanylate cyclase domain-containing protein [Niveispirillum lacus]